MLRHLAARLLPGLRGRAMIQGCGSRLVGIARLEPTKDMLLDKFLRLPSDCKALMSAQFAFNPSQERSDAA